MFRLIRRWPSVAFLLLVTGVVPGFAQRSRLDCPRPVRISISHIRSKPCLELSAGFSRPILYRNAAGTIGGGHEFVSRLSPYVAATVCLPVNERLELFAGLGLRQVWQGLRFEYSDGLGSVRITSYAGSAVLSLPVGLRYRVGGRLQLSAGPYLAYASHSGHQETAAGRGTGGYATSYVFDAPDDAGLNTGLRIGADIRVAGRLMVSLSWATDALLSAASYVRTDLGNRTGEAYEARLEPRLMHAAFGLSYRLFAAAQ